MTHEHARERVAELDRREQWPAELVAHIESCGECRAFVERLAAAEATLRADEIARAAALDSARGVDEMAATEAIMIAIRVNVLGEAPARVPGWTAGFIVIVASLVLIQFSQVVEWLRGSIGTIVDVLISSMLGIVLTVYILVLVGMNLDSVRRIFRLR